METSTYIAPSLHYLTLCSVELHQKTDLQRYFAANCKTMCDDGLLVRSLSIPTVQLDAPTTSQQNLTIYLHRRLSGPLVTCVTARVEEQ